MGQNGAGESSIGAMVARPLASGAQLPMAAQVLPASLTHLTVTDRFDADADANFSLWFFTLASVGSALFSAARAALFSKGTRTHLHCRRFYRRLSFLSFVGCLFKRKAIPAIIKGYHQTTTTTTSTTLTCTGGQRNQRKRVFISSFSMPVF